MAGLATPLASAAARARVAPRPSRASRRNVPAEARGDVSVSHASRRAGTPRRDVSARVGLSDPGYWESVTALMTPSVAVDLPPPSLAALAIGGVLVLGHSWESIEASRGWKEAKRAKDASKNARPAENASPATTTTAPSPISATAKKTNQTKALSNQKIMTRAEREAAEAEARASRVLAVAAARAELTMKDLSSANGISRDESRERLKPRAEKPVKIEVCTNNACAKRGGKELLRALEAMAEGNKENGVNVECRRSRCMDACALACVVRVNGVGGLQRHAHVGADEAKEIFELATGVAVE
jgi:NADH:ubiquinone oxidoreductase subunit E